MQSGIRVQRTIEHAENPLQNLSRLLQQRDEVTDTHLRHPFECLRERPHQDCHDAPDENALTSRSMGNFHQHPALVRTLALRDGVHTLRCGAQVLPASCRAPDPHIRGDRGRGAPLCSDVQGDADAYDCGRDSAHHRGGCADLGEPSLGRHSAGGPESGAWAYVPPEFALAADADINHARAPLPHEVHLN